MAEKLLVVDTSTPCCGIALGDGARLVGELQLDSGAQHAVQLVEGIDLLLQRVGWKMQDIEVMAAVAGPGSFTGLRVGLATVKGLAMACSRPVVGVSSLKTLAAQLPFCRWPVCALLDARKREVYAGRFDCSGEFPEPLAPETVLSPERLEILEDTVFIGTGAIVYRAVLEGKGQAKAHFAPESLTSVRTVLAAELALRDYRAGRWVSPERLMPVYIRPSEAELARGA
ncbi:MAG: tRNA (adenosine(37)-N6)-threonylcarbamoyltransferase complex dimerization subunit type 1 TsaB [Deltaproteobacteria bacterium]|nr:tRNA (adenosine(37)-N6)-threonylcarbamoyltransferase complex dimerization subunit type 1 TsaB [Deltaproteobacteria bacterium]